MRKIVMLPLCKQIGHFISLCSTCFNILVFQPHKIILSDELFVIFLHCTNIEIKFTLFSGIEPFFYFVQ